MFKYFIDAARQHSQLPTTARPKLLLITSSSNDPLQWVDYYLQHFNAAGADALWLPLEPAMTSIVNSPDACLTLNQQRFIHNGQYNRAAHYPDLAAYQLALCQQPERLEALINEADAIFINGGDQSLTIQSLQLPSGEFSKLGKLLLAKINQGTPLAGSSAGTAVQSGHSSGKIPMITGGRSGPAWRLGALSDQADSPLCYFHQRCTAKAAAGQLTYKADGGLGSFSLGVVDTHFRERNREGRLLRLLLDTNTAFGFGVDEATVLRAQFDSENSARLSVAGAGGVWIIESRKATQNYTRQSANDPTVSGSVRVANLTATRLLAGDTASFSLQSQNDVGLNEVKLHCDDVAKSVELRPDLAAYQEDAALIWQVGTTQQACQRADGRWRYTNLPLAVQAPTELNSQLR
jgi:cyanophycinase